MGTVAKSKLLVKSFNKPDETRAFAQHGHADLVELEGVPSVLHGVFEPGWRWSADVKPIVNTSSCQATHFGYVLRGRMRVKMDDGTEADIGAGDVVRIPPGHDAWVLGDEACEMVDFGGYSAYAAALRGPGKGAGSTEAEAPRPGAPGR